MATSAGGSRCARGGEDPWAFIKRNEGRIKSFHYKDFDMSKDSDVDTWIGNGTLDNEIFMQFSALTWKLKQAQKLRVVKLS